MAAKKPKISVIIPVYNDAKYLRACLQAVFNQTFKPYQVIVVDNNCTDDSIEIARKFKRVKVVKESRQGLCFARYTGFEHGKGEYLVRIDTDTNLPKDYLEQVSNYLANNIDVAGISCYGVSRFESIPNTSNFWNWCYFTYTKAYFGYQMLWGSNMVIRSSYWRRLKHHLINDDELVHEDQDLSLALASVGGKAKIMPNIVVSVQMEGVQHYGKYRKYVRMMRYLKRLDKYNKRSRLKRRLKKTNIAARVFYWLVSAWSIYVFYVITIFYSIYWNINYWLKAH